jgi:hypothetical protein
MGSRFITFSPLLMAAAIALPAPAGAQDNASAPPPSLVPPRPSPAPAQRQGPELNVFRDGPGTTPAPVAPPPVAPPPVTTTVAPPVVVPTRASQSQTQPTPRPQRAPGRTIPPAERETDESPAGPPPMDEPPPSNNTAAPDSNAAEQAPVATPPAPVPSAVTPPAPTETSVPWGWIGGALAVVVIGALALFLRRRPSEATVENDDAAVPEPVAPPPPANTRRPTPPTQPSAERPWIDIDLMIENARHGVAGVSIGYRLTLHNRGANAASDILIHALIGNADANQNELLRAFFSGTTGQPVHSVVEIAPGRSAVLTNELRLSPEAIEPLELDGRLLMVPLIGFDVHYRWDTSGAPGSGRSGSAFVVGQEQAPPGARLAPFRYDQGPRQYRAVACRRTALSLAS